MEDKSHVQFLESLASRTAALAADFQQSQTHVGHFILALSQSMKPLLQSILPRELDATTAVVMHRFTTGLTKALLVKTYYPQISVVSPSNGRIAPTPSFACNVEPALDTDLMSLFNKLNLSIAHKDESQWDVIVITETLQSKAGRDFLGRIKGFDVAQLQEHLRNNHSALFPRKIKSIFLQNMTRDATSSLSAEPVLCADALVQQASDVITKQHGGNLFIIGPSGRGKSSLLAAIAAADHLEPTHFSYLDTAKFLSGVKFACDFEDRIAQLRDDLTMRSNSVLMVDSPRLFLIWETMQNFLDLSSLLKPALENRSFRIIATATPAEYRKICEIMPSLMRLFTPIHMPLLTLTETRTIARHHADRIGQFHGCSISDALLSRLLMIADRGESTVSQPARVIALIDEVFATQRARALSSSDEALPFVAAQHGLPATELLSGFHSPGTKQRARALVDLTKERVFGQDEAVTAIAKTVRRGLLGFKQVKTRPLGAFLLMGPSGVGKTESAKAFADIIFNQKIIRFDMGEFSQEHEVAKFIGSPPGYIGHGDGGILTEALRKNTSAVLLFDEVEKAHPKVFDVLLRALDEGFISDSKGELFSLADTLVILTSNLGLVESLNADALATVGFGRSNQDSGKQNNSTHKALAFKQVALKAAQEHFRPEFLNRLDGVLVFNALSEDAKRKIAQRIVTQMRETLVQQRLFLSDESHHVIVEDLMSHASHPAEGARPMIRLLAERFAEAIISTFLDGDYPEDTDLTIEVNVTSGEAPIAVHIELPAKRVWDSRRSLASVSKKS